MALALAVSSAVATAITAAAVSADEARLIEKQFTLPPGFSIRLVAAEPDLANPMTMCVDAAGHLFVTEAHTYRWGPKASPYQPPTNPIKRIELGPDGRAVRTVVAASGFAEPVIGVFAREGQVYADCLNELFVMDVRPDGTLANRKLLVKDDAVPWNPFGFYRVQVGPDDKLWLCIADHPSSLPVTLTGADGRKLQLRGKTGGMVRCNLDGSGLELVVQGFRAPYVFDFDPWGHLWHISNGEGSPNLYLHVIPGMDYGYHSRDASYAWLAGKEPLSPPVHEMPGGANTGALHYYSSQFPADYWGNVLIANWGSHGSNSQNRMVYRFKRQKDGRDRIGGADDALTETAPFLTSTDPMFRPTQLVPAHDGGLYLIDWHGRDDENDTTGRILKIDYTGPGKPGLHAAPAPDTIARMKPDALVKLLGHLNHFTRECAVRALAKTGAAAVKPLGQTARSGDALAAANAIWALTRIHTPAATEAMTEALRHTDPRVRAHALRQLRQAFGQPLDSSSRVATESLAKFAAPLLRDANGEVRVEAALAQASPESVARGLITALEKADNERLRYQIGFELARHADGEALLPLLNSADANLKRVALIALDVAAYEKTPLAEAMNKLAPKTLEQIPPARFGQKLEWLRRNRPGEFAVEFKRLDSGEVQLAGREDKLVALEAIDHAALPEIPAAFVVASLGDRDPRVQEEALRTVRRCAVAAPEVLPATLRIIETAKAPQVLGAAIYVLGLRGDATKAEQWLPLFKNPSDEVATAALRALRQTPQKAELIEALLGVAPELAKRGAGLAEEVAFTLRTLGVAESLCGKFAPGPPSAADKAALARSILARLPKASARLGQLTFESAKGCCATCHSIRPGENRFGPSLAGLGATAQPEYLIESILEPSKVIKTGFESEAVEAKDGRSWSGVVELAGDKLTIRIAFDERVIVPLDQIKRRSPSPVSPMPEGLELAMSEQELADLVAHLRTLKP